jgi:hypothetical protein
MPVSELSAPKRLSITLDPGLVLERLILRRLADPQRKRGRDWLRSLLVQGFLAEGRWLRTGEPGGGEDRAPHGARHPSDTVLPLAGRLARERPHRPGAAAAFRGRANDAAELEQQCQALCPSPQGDRLNPMTHEPEVNVADSETLNPTSIGLDDGYAFTKIALTRL